MASFRETDEACADCGADTFAATDAVEPGGETPLCFSCYVDRVDRVRAYGVLKVADEGEFVVGAPSTDEAEGLARRVADELRPAGVVASVKGAAPLAEARDELGDYHARELALGSRSETRHVYAGTSERGTVVDVETRTDDGTRGEVRDALARHVCDEAGVRLRKRGHVPDAVTTVLPTLVEHGTTRRLGIERAAWERAKERGVSRASERSGSNVRAGHEFEEWFREWCEERNIELHRGKSGLVRHHPEAADEIAHKTDGLTGVPDFLVRGSGQKTFGSEWRPNGDVFVEVKLGDSALTSEQQTVVAHLKALGFDVYVFRGDSDQVLDHHFERR